MKPNYRPLEQAIGYRFRKKAVLELERPVRLPSLTPYGIGPTPTVQADDAVVSYARDRANAASLQRVCHVLDQSRGAPLAPKSAEHDIISTPRD